MARITKNNLTNGLIDKYFNGDRNSNKLYHTNDNVTMGIEDSVVLIHVPYFGDYYSDCDSIQDGRFYHFYREFICGHKLHTVDLAGSAVNCEFGKEVA